jgi:hypothetical protein
MGLLVDRLAETLGKLRRLQSQLVNGGRAVEAARLQHNLVDRLQQVVLQIDGSSVDARAERVEAAIEAAKTRFPRSRGGKGIKKKGRRKPGRLIWTCCGEPRRSTNRKGKPIWVAACNWKKGKRKGQTIRVVGMGSSKPQAVKLKGKRMKRCQKPTPSPAPKK